MRVGRKDSTLRGCGNDGHARLYRDVVVHILVVIELGDEEITRTRVIRRRNIKVPDIDVQGDDTAT